MATIYYPTSASIQTRVVETTNLTAINIGVVPDVIFVLTSSGVPFTASIVSSSYALTASFAQNGGGGGGVTGADAVWLVQFFS